MDPGLKTVIATLGGNDTRFFRSAPAGRWIATVAGATATVWAPRGVSVATLPHRAAISALVWTRDRLYAALVDGGVAVWSTATWREIGHIAAHETWLPSIVASPDGELLWTAGYDGTVRIGNKLALRRLTVRELARPSGGWYPTMRCVVSEEANCSHSCHSCDPIACATGTSCPDGGSNVGYTCESGCSQ